MDITWCILVLFIIKHHFISAGTNPVTVDGEDLGDVKIFTYLGSIIDEHGGSDATEEHLTLKTTVNQHQGQNLQYECQDSSTVWGGNLENYERHHPENTCVY
ncbi:unnamed protein product [Schistosoma curassoni]|uniref:Uncharacterized protein n=1 Tax=Schistosoma curassoni TaxID=6186 RepID=A0A183KP06_9TREM|nr:unnamed protein product [Schistosoma curassoni]